MRKPQGFAGSTPALSVLEVLPSVWVPVLKTVEGNTFVGSNPTTSALAGSSSAGYENTVWNICQVSVRHPRLGAAF